MSNEDIMEVFRAREDVGEPLMASEVVERGDLDCSERTVLSRLHELEGEGLKSKRVGAGSRVWWIPIDD